MPPTTPVTLETLGWNERTAAAFAAAAKASSEPGRVILEHQHLYRVATARGEAAAVVAGHLRHAARSREDFPAVGDWVVVSRPAGTARLRIEVVLPRWSRFLRKVAGSETEAQVIAANLDLVFITAGLDADYNLRRIERYLVTTWESGATPVIVLNKADLCETVDDRVEHVQAIAEDVPVHAISCVTGQGLPHLEAHLEPGRTVALLGSSGVGKSTIINRLLGFERQRTKNVGVDSRGRHTTTNRELIVLPSGGLLVDTPGMRELQLWDVGDAVLDAFTDVREAAQGCHFRDCRHDAEPRCAVKSAVDAGEIPRARLENYRRLQRELDQLALRQDARRALDEKRHERLATRPSRRSKSRG